MTSEIEPADLQSIVKVVGPDIEITYELLPEPAGYGLAAQITGDPAGAIRINGLTTDPVAAGRILTLLADNLVFPYNIPEVLDDLLAIEPLP